MFDVELDGLLESIVVIVAALQFEVYEQTEVAVEAQQLLLLLLVSLEFLLKADGVASTHNVRRPAVHAVAVLAGQERLNADAVLLVMDLLSEILSAAVTADVFALLNVYEDVIG